MNALHPLRRRHVARNVNELHDASSTFGDRVADAVARFGGSWTFILLFIAVLVLWVGVNSLGLLLPSFDPYPFIFLNLLLSCLAALQAPIILMSQNRQAARDRLMAENDYECNLKAELEVEQLHEKLDLLRERQWTDLVQMQQRQIALLEQLLADRAREAPSVPEQAQFSGEPVPPIRRPRRRRAAASS
jgi:uncharacterized membrane protein